jgi:enoyl-CoA hydratase
MTASTTFEDGVAVIRMELGKGNAIDDAFVAAMTGALDDVEASDARATVVTGAGRAFSGGLDLAYTGGLSREELGRFVDAFDAFFTRAFAFPLPVVAAVNGHAVAGGAVLALAADRRIMARGPFRIGLNEVAVGIPFPSGAFEISRHALPAPAFGEAFLEGRLFSPEEALEVGFVHRVVDGEVLIREAVQKAHQLSTGSRAAIRIVKADDRAPVLARIRAERETRKARFLEAWFSADAQARMRAIRERIGRAS